MPKKSDNTAQDQTTLRTTPTPPSFGITQELHLVNIKLNSIHTVWHHIPLKCYKSKIKSMLHEKKEFSLELFAFCSEFVE